MNFSFLRVCLSSENIFCDVWRQEERRFAPVRWDLPVFFAESSVEKKGYYPLGHDCPVAIVERKRSIVFCRKYTDLFVSLFPSKVQTVQKPRTVPRDRGVAPGTLF